MGEIGMVSSSIVGENDDVEVCVDASFLVDALGPSCCLVPDPGPYLAILVELPSVAFVADVKDHPDKKSPSPMFLW